MDISPIEMNKNKKVDNWEIWQYCHNLTTKNTNFASCRGNSTKLVLLAHLLVLYFSLILSFVFFFKNRENIHIWSLHSRNHLACSICNLRAMRTYEQSLFWFIGTTLLSVKRKLLSCSPCSYQYAWLLNASAYWGPRVLSDTYLDIVRPLLLLTSIRN